MVTAQTGAGLLVAVSPHETCQVTCFHTEHPQHSHTRAHLVGNVQGGLIFKCKWQPPASPGMAIVHSVINLFMA